MRACVLTLVMMERSGGPWSVVAGASSGCAASWTTTISAALASAWPPPPATAARPAYGSMEWHAAQSCCMNTLCPPRALHAQGKSSAQLVRKENKPVMVNAACSGEPAVVVGTVGRRRRRYGGGAEEADAQADRAPLQPQELAREATRRSHCSADSQLRRHDLAVDGRLVATALQGQTCYLWRCWTVGADKWHVGWIGLDSGSSGGDVDTVPRRESVRDTRRASQANVAAHSPYQMRGPFFDSSCRRAHGPRVFGLCSLSLSLSHKQANRQFFGSGQPCAVQMVVVHAIVLARASLQVDREVSRVAVRLPAACKAGSCKLKPPAGWEFSIKYNGRAAGPPACQRRRR